MLQAVPFWWIEGQKPEVRFQDIKQFTPLYELNFPTDKHTNYYAVDSVNGPCIVSIVPIETV